MLPRQPGRRHSKLPKNKDALRTHDRTRACDTTTPKSHALCPTSNPPALTTHRHQHPRGLTASINTASINTCTRARPPPEPPAATQPSTAPASTAGCTPTGPKRARPSTHGCSRPRPPHPHETTHLNNPPLPPPPPPAQPAGCTPGDTEAVWDLVSFRGVQQKW